MPERDKSVGRISAAIIGATQWDGLTGDVRHPAIRRNIWQGLQALVDEVWVREVQKIDWNRVILTGHNRHMELRRQEEETGREPHGPTSRYSEGPILGMSFGDEEDVLCPDCLVGALLLLSTYDGDFQQAKDPSTNYAHQREDLLWRADWLDGANGSFSIVQSIIPHALKAAETHEEERKKKDPYDSDGNLDDGA